MGRSRARWMTGIGLLSFALGASALTFWYLGRRSPEPIPTAALPDVAGSTLNVTETPFTSWMKFERMQEHRDLFERFYVDLMLGHQVFKLLPSGLPAHQARALLLDDDDLLFPSGRRLWNRELLPQPGQVGKYCYVHSNYCVRRLFEVYFVVDGKPVVIYDNFYSIERFPSRTVVRYRLGTVAIDEHKYITDDDRAVSSFRIQSLDGKPHSVSLKVVAENPAVPGSVGTTTFPLLAQGQYAELPLYIYLDAPEFEIVDTFPIHLRRSVSLGGSEAVRVDVAASFENAPRAEPLRLPPDLLERHVTAYQQWFADNVPYFDAPDGLIKRMWYYRWWIVRFHRMEPSVAPYQGWAFYEGMLGFDNLISFAAPAQLKELTYLRDPVYGIDQARNSYRNRSPIGALVDASGSPYWGEMYSQWTTAALAEFHRVHPIDEGTVREMLPGMVSDVRAWTRQFDTDGDSLPSRDIPRITGYDLDILSWWYFNDLELTHTERPPPLERVDFASFVYANARGLAELATSVGDVEVADEASAVAERIRTAVVDRLWDEESGFFYPQTAEGDTRIPIRELHGLFAFTSRLAPDEARYHRALEKLVDPAEFWARYPPVITSQAHYRDWTWKMDGLTRNIAPHPISMGGLTLIRVLHDYDQDIVTPRHFMELLSRYTSLMYPGTHPNDPGWRPNAHEYYSEWEAGARSLRPKPSDISHDFHSMYCALVVEGAIGLKPRVDDLIELRPAALEWPYFALDRLRYRGHDLTIVWDQPDGEVRYEDYPEGFSLAIDGERVFTRPDLRPVVYDPATKTVTAVGEG